MTSWSSSFRGTTNSIYGAKYLQLCLPLTFRPKCSFKTTTSTVIYTNHTFTVVHSICHILCFYAPGNPYFNFLIVIFISYICDDNDKHQKCLPHVFFQSVTQPASVQQGADVVSELILTVNTQQSTLRL